MSHKLSHKFVLEAVLSSNLLPPNYEPTSGFGNRNVGLKRWQNIWHLIVGEGLVLQQGASFICGDGEDLGSNGSLSQFATC